MRALAFAALLLGGCTALFPLDYTTAPADATAPTDTVGLDAALDGDPPCPKGFDRCGGAACIDLRSNASRCGSCTVVCALSNATAACENGACVAASCNPGYGDCDNDPSTGCETNLSTAMAHCGRCGNACAATAACREGVCRVSGCAAGLGNCDGDDANGCETDTNTTPAHCGGCGRACALPNATATCVAGACRVGTCAAGFGDCDGDSGNGCETALNTVAHCGRCDVACPATGATSTCEAGVCRVGACAMGFGDCDGNVANGCEADLRTDGAHCGACRNRCSGSQSCSAGRCVSTCAAGEMTCGMSCVNVATNVNHCGACDRRCEVMGVGTPTCVAGTCGVACPAGQGNCDGNPTNGCEVSLAGNVSHCGACGMMCASLANSNPSCGASGCGFVCNFGWANCNAMRDDGCETQTGNDLANCGRCGARCAPANAVGVCNQSACQIRACNPGFADCDGNVSNGCEVNTLTSNTHCGGCGRACSLARAMAACREGACQVTSCNSNYANCDNDPTNGCEVNLTNTTAHCGACGQRCAASCSGGACCGVQGEPCCSGSCTTGVCYFGRCSVNCGGLNQPCCGLGACGVGTVCNVRVFPAVCVSCGALNQPCCGGGSCREGRCSSGVCR
jgi:hypothetical protein